MSEENNNNNEKVTTAAGTKRDNEEATAPSVGEEPNKKIKSEDEDNKPALPPADESAESHAFVPPGTVGVTQIGDNDVLSGRGGGTNLHPGNRQFRDLINLYRRDYLKARKNDKPAISRSIVNSIREKEGRFLKKVEKTGLWFEIGDDAAREKTSQALRQRAPEMRKLLLDHEMEGVRAQQQHTMMMGMPPGMPPPMMMQGMPMMMPNGNMAFNPAMMGMPSGMFMGMPPMGFNGMPPPNPNNPNGMPPAPNGMPGQPPMGMPGMPNNGSAPGENGEANPDGSGAPMMNGLAPMNMNQNNDGNNNNNNSMGNNTDNTGGGDPGGADNSSNNNNPDMQPLNAMGMKEGAAMGQVPNTMGGPESSAPVVM